MRTSVNKRMAEKRAEFATAQAVMIHLTKTKYDTKTVCQKSLLDVGRYTQDVTEVTCPECRKIEQRACLQASRAFIKCECCETVYADAEYKINGVGTSIYLCKDCADDRGDLDNNEQLELIERIG